MLKKIDRKGFSIIEVLIVLAIAGLIMLIVFLAVPALRRNAANNGRQSDASRISSAVQECLANRNGKAYSCNAIAAGKVDVGDLSQLEPTQVTFTNYVDEAGTPQGTVTFGADPYVPSAVANDVDAITSEVIYSSKCSTDGSGAISSTNVRDFTIVYMKRGSSSVATGNTSVCIGS